jgi:hypothetical protein
LFFLKDKLYRTLLIHDNTGFFCWYAFIIFLSIIIKSKAMRTKKKYSIEGKITALLLIAVSFLLPGCQKEDVMPAGNNISNENTNIQRAIPVLFPVITIDHRAGKYPSPDYKVTIHSSGKVVFEGRQNTAITGIKEFMISEMEVEAFKNMFVENQFSLLPSASYVPDIPYVVTSFRHNVNTDPVIRADHDGINRSKLIDLRTNVETLLGIQQYIYQEGIPENSPVN